MCLHQCRLLGGFSDSQSWAQHSEIKKNKAKRRSDAGRVNAGFWENRRRPRGLGALLWRPMQTGGQDAQPQSQRTQTPHRHPAHQGRVSGSSPALPPWAQRRRRPPRRSPPQDQLLGRCAPDNQHHGPSPDPTQTICCRQVVGPQRLQSFSSAWNVGSRFLCTLCSFLTYFLWFFFINCLILIFCMYLRYFFFYFHGTLIVFHILGFRIF